MNIAPTINVVGECNPKFVYSLSKEVTYTNTVKGNQKTNFPNFT